MTRPIAPGAPVIVVNGLAAGMRGTAREIAKIRFGEHPLWTVEFPFPLCARAIREDFLELAPPALPDVVPS